MNYQDFWQKNQKYILSALGGILATLVIIFSCFYTTKPELIDPPKSTKEATITLKGRAQPKTGITVFDSKDNSIVMIQTNDQGEFTVTGLPINEGDNIFYVRAVKSKYRVSLPLKVIVSKDATAPSLEVDSFASSTVTGSNTTISGKAEPGSTVTVNGVKTNVNSDGTWSATIALTPGKNTVTVAATDSAGNTTTNTQTLTYTPSTPDSQSGTVKTATSTTSYSEGSNPPADSSDNLGPYFLNQDSPTGTIPLDESTQPPPVSDAVKPTELEKTITSMIVTAWVSNPSPNTRSNEIIYARVRDNYGRPVNNASVSATVTYKTGSVYYYLKHSGNGEYSVSFKLNDKYVAGHVVSVEVTAGLSGIKATDYTSFTPQ